MTRTYLWNAAAALFFVLGGGQAAPPADAPLPSNVKLGWGDEPVATISATRASISLSGVWRFLPAESGEAARDPQAGWGYVRVPGNWKNDADIVARGAGRAWQTFNGDSTAQAWYERTITVPADWAGRAVLLDVARVSTDAQVFVDGKEAGRIAWPASTLDITNLVTAGKTATLRLRVIATDDRAQVPVYMGYLNTETRPANLDTKGIIGDVTLLTRPHGAHVADLLVRPSTRKKTLDVDIELTGLARPGDVHLTARLLNEKNKVEKTFTKTMAVKAAVGTQTVTVSWPWPNPRLWDVGRPNRYTLRLEAKGAGLSDEYAQEFGFREFWIKGKKFFLNNTEIRLRPGLIQYGNRPTRWLQAGYNFGEIWPENRARRGTGDNDADIVAEADRIGLPISGNLLFLADWVNDLTQWEKPATRADFQRQMERQVRRMRNHPSVVIWGTSGNALGSAQGDGDPWLIGMQNNTNVQERLDRRARVREAIRMVQQVDPTRAVFGHHSDDGDVHTSNLYLNFLPLQEREEWLSRWAEKGEKPFMAVEFGLPLYASLMRGRDGYTHQGHSEPFLSEWAASYLGPAAYKTEPAAYRDTILAARYKGGGDVQHEYDPHIRANGGDRIVTQSPAFQQLLDLFITNTWRAWRTWGVTGGMVPWHHDDHSALARVNGPSLAWIAGPAGLANDLAAFTAKDHSFRAGEIVAKQIILLNDHRAPQPFSATWTISVGGKTVARGSKTGRLAVAQTLRLPISFIAPAVASNRKADGVITLSASVGPDKHADTFPFRVFAPIPKTVAAPPLTVFDPAGETSALLKSLGYAVTPWRAGQPAPNAVAVIGRGALSSGGAVAPGDLTAFVRGGGRLLVMAQAPEWIKDAWQLRTAPYLARRVFRVSATHLIVRGLDDDDLRDWRGASRLVPSHPRYPGYEWLATYGWHWGNRGAVSSAPIEKPHRTSWRPILETEFDLAYTPLMEMEYGRGRVTLCTLDLEDHAASDPAAQKLARQLIEYVCAAPITPKARRVIYLGGASGAKTLDALGVRYESAAGLPTETARDDETLYVVENAAQVTFGEEHLRRGARVLYLRAATSGPNVEKASGFIGSLNPPAWPEARGLSASDLRWRAAGEAWLLKKRDGVEIGANGLLGRRIVGKGVEVFCQIDPAAVTADEKRYFRFTRWRQTRVLSQILANLGATFQQDEHMMALLQKPGLAVSLAGVWDVQLTDPRKESPRREWNADPGLSARAKTLVATAAPVTGWQKVSVPAYMESYGPRWRFTDGEAVFRKIVTVPARLAGRDLFLSLGRVDEDETTFVNGEKIGQTRSWLFPRGHVVPGRLVRPGKNVIVVRVWDQGIHGGMTGSPDHLYLRTVSLPTGFYHDDYRSIDVEGAGQTEAEWRAWADRWKNADDPYRYFRW